MTTTQDHCRNCQAPLQDGDRFCEQCGTRVIADAPPDEGDRTELDLTIAAAVSDRGLVHRRNEDSFYLEVIDGSSVAAVVCDGTSSASAGNAAARNAAKTAGTMLAAAVADPSRDAGEAMIKAIEAAAGAVEQVPWTTRTGRVDPSCTLVSAIRRGDELVVGWVGDSRAYWLDAAGARQLTVDDSLAEEGIAKGLLTPEQAAASPVFHAITHWVGPDSPERPPRLAVLTPEAPGRLLLCTDGLWNYVSSELELAELIAALPATATALELARALADTAVSRGGEDNVTVAVVEVQ
jgi:serine/threonine protein phosphatase PrpC